MTVFDVLEQHGPWRLAAFLAAVATFLLLHLIRVPFVLVARLLLVAQTGLNARICAAVTPTPASTSTAHGMGRSADV